MKKLIAFLLMAVLLCSAALAETSAVSVGDVITFGHYEQDNDLNNGPEPIEWVVLDVQDGKALLFSKYGLDAIQYNVEMAKVTWEKCSLRTWLNNDFMNAAFSMEEQGAILLTDVDNSASQGYSSWKTSGGNNTQDLIFLLSYSEANKYVGVEYWVLPGAEQNRYCRAAPTAYASAKEIFINSAKLTADGEATGRWWLRSPGYDQFDAAEVLFDGSLSYTNVHRSDTIVRPALWLNLE